MPENGKIEQLTENLKDYVTTNYELIKLQAIERSTVVVAGLLSQLLVGLVVVFIVLFISLWACIYLSVRLGDSYTGFAIVAGFYLLIGLILLLVRKKLVERSIRNKIIRKVFSKK
jgi:hypothetical protein